MNYELYHQLGHNDNWNFDTIEKYNSGDGVIISPRSRNKKRTGKIDSDIKKRAIFDPIILNPHETNKNMITYDYQPCLIMPEGFSTSQHSNYSHEIASKCLDFQIENDFRYLVIPTRYCKGFPQIEDVINYQTQNYINPFLKEIESKGYSKKVIVQLILNGEFIKNEEYSSKILDWVTGIDNVDGVYLITELTRRSKQIDDVDYLYKFWPCRNPLTNSS
ncbi:hypothetical protein [Methanolacinia petrolearia]|uniref:hypothetical protein n=1 Tax=Methanolacinia petrolearia TaxID=54120 RepID=UPI003BAC4F59